MRLFFLIFFLFTAMLSTAQLSRADSLKRILERPGRDTNYINSLLAYAQMYYFTKPDSCVKLAEQAIDLARDLGFKHGLARALSTAAESQRFLGDYPKAIRYNLEALSIHRERKDTLGESASLGFLGFSYMEFKEYRKAQEYIFKSIELNKRTKSKIKYTFDYSNLGNTYDLLKIPDSALHFAKLAYENYTGLTHGPLKSLVLTRLGNAYAGMNKRDSALYYYHAALAHIKQINDLVNISKAQRKLAEFYETINDHDSSLFYARNGLMNAIQSNQRLEMLETGELLSRLFRSKRLIDSAFFYQDFAKRMSDSLYGPVKFRQLQMLMLDEQKKQQDIISEQEEYKNRSKMIALLSVAGVLALVGFLLFRSNRNKQKSKIKIETAYEKLKNTQAQLIQKEKMASLGELTAGIAHEIQNPLNFVNNFSEVNRELIDEMNTELEAGNLKGAQAISKNIRDNEEKIIIHGKRADGIVKSMLQHSRISNGKKEPVDINALADEYLRLAYHGLRAKDKTFNARFETDFDPLVGTIHVVSQDIGRVLLNLINNAFYAVSLRKTNEPSGTYEPLVKLATRKNDDKIFISVSDNGTGIPSQVREKIFQPFFTTKPAGEGTGLGLSLAYDIIIKGHNGDLKVKTMENEGTEFIIVLPST